MDQPRLEKALTLMKIMSGKETFSIDELAEKMETSYRSIYRFLDTFRSAGFAVEKVHGNVYRIAKMPASFKGLDKLVYFSEEESRLLCGLIEALDTTNSLKASLSKKLYAVYESTGAANFVINTNNAANIEALGNAIRTKKSVILRKYASANSGVVRDRMVEPFGFTTNYIDIWAYDIEDGKNKLFKIARIDSIDMKGSWEFEDKHQKGYLDIFRMCSFTQTHVKLELSLRAKNLLCEEYPLSPTHIHQKDGKWILDTLVSDLKGVGRFVIGLAGDIKVIDSPELEEYIQDFAKENFGK